MLVQVADYGSFTPLLGLALLYLFSKHDLKPYEIIATIILLLVLAGLTVCLLMGLWRTMELRHFLDWLQRTVNTMMTWLKRPPLFADEWAQKNANDFIEAARAVIAHPQKVSRAVIIALACHVVNLSSLYALFLGFHQPVGFETLLAGYAMGFLFAGVAVIPQGIGVVEGGMVLVYTSLGISVEKAAVIALTFRGFSFWIPLVIGFLFFRQMKALEK